MMPPLDGVSDEVLKRLTDIAVQITFALALASAIIGVASAVAGGELGRRSEKSIRSADGKAAKALDDAAIANKRAEEIKGENLKLAIALEQEKIERLRLLHMTAPRILDLPERAKLIAAFKGSGQKIRVIADSDMEAEGLARDFIDAFKEAGVAIDYQSIGSPLRNSYGFSYYDPAGPTGPFGSRMISIFTASGYQKHEPFAEQRAGLGLDQLPTLEIRLRPQRLSSWRPLVTGPQ